MLIPIEFMLTYFQAQNEVPDKLVTIEGKVLDIIRGQLK